MARRLRLIHVQFETIHPFLDGNGRLGRLLITLLLRNYGLLTSPLLYLSLFFKKNRQLYYQLLNGVRINGDWEAWTTFFLEGIREVSQDVVDASEKLQELVTTDRKKLLIHPKATVASIRLLDELPKKPILTTNQAASLLKLTIPPVRKAINVLVECGILSEVSGKKKDRVYRYTEYLKILADGTEL